MLRLSLPSRRLILLVISHFCLLMTVDVLADQWDENYQSGKGALERGEWAEAIVFFQTALKFRELPDNQAATSNLKMLEYLPYFYLGQAYLMAGDYDRSVRYFQRSLRAGAVQQTQHLNNLQRLLAIARNLRSYHESTTENKTPAVAPAGSMARLRQYLQQRRLSDALSLLQALKNRYPDDDRLTVYEQWLEDERGQVAQLISSEEQKRRAEGAFKSGLDFFVSGRYREAKRAFRRADSLSHDMAGNWLKRSDSELERLRDREEEPEPKPEPEVIERIITESTAPIFAIRSPVDNLTETRSSTIILSGLVSDGQGLDYLDISLNGVPLQDEDGNTLHLRPESEAGRRKFSFLQVIPLQMGENQIVLTAYDVDETPHTTVEQIRVIRKLPIYRTATFGVTLGAILLVVAGGYFLSRAIKYRIAIINKYNPYIAGSPIRNQEMFFGRQQLLKRLMNTLHNNSIMLYGPRRIGKTTLQHHLKRRLEQANDPDFVFIPVMVDLQGTSERNFFKTLIEEICEACQSWLQCAPELNVRRRGEAYSSRDFSKDLKTLLELLRERIQRRFKLVLQIDEVDELNKYSEKVNQKLRSVFMKTFAEDLTAVMSGTYLEKSWQSEGSPWYNFFEEVEVTPFTREDTIELITRPVAGIFTYDDAAVDKIVYYSRCQPYIVQKFCVNVINRIIEARRRRVLLEDVEAVAQQVLKSAESMVGSEAVITAAWSEA